MREILIEAAVDSLEAAIAAVEAGAGRIELCSNLDAGGLTPSAELMAAVRRKVAVPVFPMIRVRPGSFVYTVEEMEVMRAQLREMAGLGADGFVFGALTREDTIDRESTAAIVEEAKGRPVTFHRAFDRTPDLLGSLDALVALGVTRLLTSGGKERAEDGIESLATLVRQAKGRIGVLPGGGVGGSNAREIVARCGGTELHARCDSDGARVRAIRRAVMRRE